MMLIGVIAYRMTESFSDYILGGRGLGSWVTAISAQAADFSGWLLMALPGAVYATGLGTESIYICISLCIGTMLNWKYVAARLRIYTEKAKNSMTLSSFFGNRYRDESNIIQVVTSLFTIIFFTLYCTAGFVSGGVLFESLFGIDRNTATLVGGFVIVFYTFLGGFLAVVYTEVIQGFIMFSSLLITVILATLFAGGVDVIYQNVLAVNPDILSAVKTISYEKLASGATWTTTGNVTAMTIISACGWGVGYFGQPHILARFMALKSHKEMTKARLIAMTFGNVVPLYSAMLVGVIGVAIYNGTHALENPETVFIQMVRQMFNPWLAGFFLSAVMAAIMSTLSSQLLVASSSFTEDIYKGILRKGKASQSELMWAGRITVLVISAISLGLSFYSNKTILNLVGYAWSGFGSSFGPIILYSLFWKRTTRKGAIAGILAGGLTVLLWKYANSPLFEMIPGFILSAIAIPLVSLLDKPPSEEIQNEFDEMVAQANE